jgi:CDP-paratose 2-epimerase
MAIEYGATFGFPVWVNRCGVMAGAGQFGRADQGIFSYWIHSWRQKRPLRYIGFGGHGHQVRDCLHPADLVPLLERQIAAGTVGAAGNASAPAIVNVSGGAASAMSLRQLSAWCHDRFGAHDVIASTDARPFDIPWIVLDPALAADTWAWTPRMPTLDILEEIAIHAEAHPDWLDRTNSR